MIDVFINGERVVVDEAQSLSRLLAAQAFNCSRIAVAVNSEFVARGSYANYFLKNGDKVDVVAPVAGG